MIDGTSGNDTLSGGASEADYVIRGGSGNDLITGSNRANFAAYVGKYSEYTISTSAGVITVTDKYPNITGSTRSSSDGVDTLKGINLLRFADRDYFVTTAANKVSLPGGDQVYRVGNSEWVLGNTAAKETFIIKPKTSALIAAAVDDVVELSGVASAYTYKAVLAQLQITDGIYTTFINVGGAFTLRTASGSTSVAYTGGKIQLGGSQNVGDVSFSAVAAITDTSKVSSITSISSTVAPTVTPLQSSLTTPTLAGTATVGEDQTLAVIVNGVTYTTTSGLTLGASNTWSLTIPDANKLSLGQSYEVRAELRPATIAIAAVVAGTSAADVMANTNGGPALFTGGAGNDVITGGNRADVASYSGKYSEYTITTSAGVITVTDKLPSGTTRTVSDGVDTLKGINVLHFSDRDYFVTTAANKVSLPGGDQTYKVANSEWVLGNTAAVETFVVAAKTSSLIAVAKDDIVDLSRSIDAYNYKAVLAQLQISDGTFTTFINVGGVFTLRTASGSTTVAYTGGKIQLGGSQNVGDTAFNATAAITDSSKLSSNALLTIADNSSNEITLANPELSSGTFNAGNGRADVIVVDVNTFQGASISGFEKGDTLKIKNWDSVNIDALGVLDEPAHLDFLLGQDSRVLSFTDGSGFKFPDNSVVANLDEFNLLFGPNAVLFGDASPDNVAPKITVTSSKTILSAGEQVTINFALTENTQNFTASDVNPTGGTLSHFTGSGKNYSATFTANAGVTAASVSVDSGKFSDAAGNLNADGSEADNRLSFIVSTAVSDTVAPTLVSATVAANTLTMEFSEGLQSTNLPAFTSFSVYLTGTVIPVNSVSVSGPTATLTLSSSVAAGQSVALSYSDPTSGNDAAAMQDLAGNDVATFSGFSVLNSTVYLDTTPPVLNDLVVNGKSLTLTFNENLSATTALNSAFSVLSGGAVNAVTAVSVSGNLATLTLTNAVTTSQSVSLAYTDPTTGNDVNAVQDLLGNDLPSFSARAVTNVTSGGGNSATSAVTKIDWSIDNSGIATAVGGGTVEIQVHFTNPVLVTGTPRLALQLYDDAAAPTKLVYATYAPYSGATAGSSVSSMNFIYTPVTGDGDSRYHVMELGLNGGTITEVSSVGGLAADLSLTAITSPITAWSYIYPSISSSLTGTSGNDALNPFVTNTTPVTTAVLATVNGGAGDRDLLGVPVLLPSTVNTTAMANTYTLKYNSTANTIEAWGPTDTSAAVSVPVPSTAAGFPSNVENLIYYAVFKNGNVMDDNTDIKDVWMAKSTTTVRDPVNSDAFVRGSMFSDSLTVSAEPVSTRVLIQAGTGNDTITGHAGADFIYGSGGNDSIDAGDGTDRIYVDYGQDVVNGGAGSDYLVLNLTGAQWGVESRISGPLFNGLTGNWNAGTFTTTTTNRGYRFSADDAGAIKVMDYNNSSTYTTATSIETLELRLSDSDQRGYVTLVSGSASNDGLAATGTGMSIVMGLAGSDTLTASNSGKDVLMGGGGTDVLTGGTGRDLLYGGADADTMSGLAGDDWLVGGAGNDVLDGGTGTNSAGFFVYGSGTTALSFAYDATLGGVAIRQGTTNLAKITQGATSGSYVVQDLTSTTTATTAASYENFGSDTVSTVDNYVFDYSGNTSTALTVTSSQLASAFSGSSSSVNVIKVSNNYVEVASSLSSLAKLVPTATSTGLVFDVQLNSTVPQFDAMNIDLTFNASKLAYNDATTSVNSALVADKGLAGDIANTVSIGAYAASTPFDPTQTSSVASLGFNWASGVSGPVSADSMNWHMYLTRGVTSMQTVLDLSQNISFKAATANGGTATGTSGVDQFIIGGGDVVVTGGAGADQFVPTTGQVNLTIQDFTSGVDKLDMGRLMSSAGYTSVASSSSATPIAGQWGYFTTGTTLPTALQVSTRDVALDNKNWFTYDATTKNLDLFGDRASAVSQVDIGHLTIHLGSLSTGIVAADFLNIPYSSGPVI